MMPKPDFEKIALDLCLESEIDGPDTPEITEQLRLIWNARGAADRAALGVEFRRALSAGGSVEIYVEEVLKALDVET